MKVTIYDDKKEKWQSWEAKIEDEDFCFDGYGINKKEALTELKNNIDKRIEDLKALYPVIDNLMVDQSPIQGERE